MEVKNLEVKVPKDIKQFHETVFFGLTIRQAICGMLAGGVAIALYFFFIDKLGMEITSWICILAAVPFGLMGFFNYHGLNFEQFLWAWLFTNVLTPTRLFFRAENLYYTMLTEPKANRKQKG